MNDVSFDRRRGGTALTNPAPVAWRGAHARAALGQVRP
jgi:hypothetical protein